MEKLQELFTDRVNNTLGVTKKHFYDKFEVEQNLNRLDMLKQFVQFLVENNKIDIERLHKIVDYRLEIKENYLNAHDYNSNCLLMLLSIQEKPIEFLNSILR